MYICILIYMSKTRFLRDCPPRNCKSGGGIPPGNEDSQYKLITNTNTNTNTNTQILY